ncbi:DNA polymerase subunit gamma-2, mitochondrial-like [Mytilus edulis]|uniref:DNA polymerase subunit gamma-2, mitochondrial-like n=1 Tax=Mytilus edulis TaxID=6550 RepID=UPI0039EFC170
MAKASLTQMEKIISLLHKSSFVKRNRNRGKFSSYTFGPAGVLTSRNLNQLLWDSLVTSQIDTYPVENSVFRNTDEPKQLRSNLSQGTLKHLPDILQLVNYTLPFAIVQRGQTFPESLATQYDDKFLFDSSVQTSIVLQYFCSPSSALQSFDQWIQQRLLWWRKYASDPAQISCSELQTLNENTSRAFIQCQFPWGQDNVEEIISRGSNPVSDLQETTKVKLQCANGNKSYTPHLIECSTVLEHCLMACLCDAYTESAAQTGKKSLPTEKLNLHPKIAPYKLSIVSSSKSRSNEIQEVASYLNKDLRNAGIDVFHAKDSLSVEDQFIRNDMMGLPYTAILSEGTLDSGTIELRNKDTTLKEKIHLTQLKEIILKNIEF